jgi:23S rRNA-/tRNA-specific pseudouridylate synthase
MFVIVMKKKEKLDILYEDKDLIVINKPSNLLTIGTEKNRDNNFLSFYYRYRSFHWRNGLLFEG